MVAGGSLQSERAMPPDGQVSRLTFDRFEARSLFPARAEGVQRNRLDNSPTSSLGEAVLPTREEMKQRTWMTQAESSFHQRFGAKRGERISRTALTGAKPSGRGSEKNAPS